MEASLIRLRRAFAAEDLAVAITVELRACAWGHFTAYWTHTDLHY